MYYQRQLLQLFKGHDVGESIWGIPFELRTRRCLCASGGLPRSLKIRTTSFQNLAFRPCPI